MTNKLPDFHSYIQNHQPIGLAPMDGVTDEPFRQIQLQIAKPDVFFTEFVSAEGLWRGGIKLYQQLLYTSAQRPIVGQIFGKDPESFYYSTLILCFLGFDGIDLNMGCPAKTVTQHGSGAALIGKPQLALELIASAHRAISDYSSGKVSLQNLPLKEKIRQTILQHRPYSGYQDDFHRPRPTLSVKTRLGIVEPSVFDWFPLLLSQPLDFLTVHGRTLKQGYSGCADWDSIAQVVKLAQGTNIKIWGNGDIGSLTQAREYINRFRVDGILIGRAAMGNPWVFSQDFPTPAQRFSTIMLHAQISHSIFPLRRFDGLKKHFVAYVSGLPNASQLRQLLVTTNSLADLDSLAQYF
jgi:tRNA-dihydrouridine synthase